MSIHLVCFIFPQDLAAKECELRHALEEHGVLVRQCDSNKKELEQKMGEIVMLRKWTGDLTTRCTLLEEQVSDLSKAQHSQQRLRDENSELKKHITQLQLLRTDVRCMNG